MVWCATQREGVSAYEKGAASIHPLNSLANKAWWQAIFCTVTQRNPLPNSYTREHEYFSGVWSTEHVKLLYPHTHKQPSKKEKKKIMSFRKYEKSEPSGTEPLLISKKQCKWSSEMHANSAVSITVTDGFLLRWRLFDETLVFLHAAAAQKLPILRNLQQLYN